MAPLLGFDSAFAPTPDAAKAAFGAGARFWYGYGSGPGTYHTWSEADWQVIDQAGLFPGYLWVPSLDLSEDPIQAAHDAVGDAETLGVFGAVTLDTEHVMGSPLGRLVEFVDGFCDTITMGYGPDREPVVYSGAGYVPKGVASFAPLWGSSGEPGAGQAIQYGPATRYGMAVDVDLADPAFPLASFTRSTVGQPLPPIHPPIEEETMELRIGPQGEVVIAGNAKDNGDLMVFTGAGGRWSVIDVTQALHNGNPSDPRSYKID